MDNGKPVPIGVWVLLAFFLAPFAIMMMPMFIFVMLRSPILSGFVSATVASAFICGVVRFVNYRDNRRQARPRSEDQDAGP